MSKEPITGSPLTRRLTLGSAQPTTEQEAEREQPPEQLKHTDVKTPKHTDTKTLNPDTDEQVRTTIYLPKKLKMQLKIHATRSEEDMSEIITRLVEKHLAAQE